jgi:hypothetical protein
LGVVGEMVGETDGIGTGVGLDEVGESVVVGQVKFSVVSIPQHVFSQTVLSQHSSFDAILPQNCPAESLSESQFEIGGEVDDGDAGNTAWVAVPKTTYSVPLKNALAFCSNNDNAILSTSDVESKPLAGRKITLTTIDPLIKIVCTVVVLILTSRVSRIAVSSTRSSTRPTKSSSSLAILAISSANTRSNDGRAPPRDGLILGDGVVDFDGTAVGKDEAGECDGD